MEIEFVESKDDYRQFYKEYFLNIFLSNIYSIVIFPLILAFIVGSNPFTLWKFLSTLIITASIFLWYIILNPFIKINRNLVKHPIYDNLNNKRILITVENGLKLILIDKEIMLNWESIKSVVSLKRYLCIFLYDNRFILIPIDSFPNEALRINLIGLINSKLRTTIPKKENKSRPPYYLGLLCIIPVVGAFVGIYLIIIGAFKFKNKVLIISGLFGIILSLIVVGYFTRDIVKQRNDLNKSIEIKHFTQQKLNALVKDIEFYNLIKNNYPESLLQLENIDPSVDIVDVLPLGKSNYRRNIFIYEKINNKYRLFSIGPDGKPQTNDDIFPTIMTTDSSRIGLIK